MAKELKREVQYYYDSHPTKEDLMGETAMHARLIRHLVSVLEWLFHGENCAIYDNLNFYQTRERMEYPVAPDIAVIKGVQDRNVRSWTVGLTGPAPQVVFEILSEETWQTDLKEKLNKYAAMGVQEYFAFDPNEPPIRRRGAVPRLLGWRLDAARQEMVPLVADPQGRLWSEHLESWLVPNQASLQLYDRHYQLRLTQAEAEAQRADAAAQKADAATRRAQALAEKLRSLGVNPDEL